MFPKMAVLLLFLTFIVARAMAAEYNYLSPQELKSWVEKDKEVMIVDIRNPEEFAINHIQGAIETNAYPAKTEEERSRLDLILERINDSSFEVVIVCPRGGTSAKNTFDHLRGKGVAAERLFILENGMEGWPYPELCIAPELGGRQAARHR